MPSCAVLCSATLPSSPDPLTLTHPPLLACAAAPSVPQAGSSSTFSFSATDAQGAADITGITFSVNGGAAQTATFTTVNTTGVQSSPTFTHTTGGATTVVFTVTDAGKATCTKSLSYTVNAPPVCSTLTISPSPARPNQAATFTFTGSDANLVADLTTLTFTVNGGASSSATFTSTSTTAVSATKSWTPTATGPHTAVFTLTDSRGSTCTKSLTFDVANAAPFCGAVSVGMQTPPLRAVLVEDVLPV